MCAHYPAGRPRSGDGLVTAVLRPVAAPFVAAPPGGTRVRARLRVSPGDEAALRAVGAHLGSLAGRDLAARCGEGRLDAKGKAVSRAGRKRALTAVSSSRWAGAITRTSENQVRLAEQNLRAGQASLRTRVRAIEARLAVQVGGKPGRTRGYATTAERHAKAVRLQALKARLGRVPRQLDTGAVSVVRGGKAQLRKRGNLAAAGLTEAQWRRQWESARLFLTADGEKDKPLGNETIRWHPDEGWLEVKLPAPLAEARAEGRERAADRPARGRQGRHFRRLISGIPTGRFRDRLTQMACNAGLSVIVIDPAYTSRWAAQHWLAPLRQHHPKATGHHAAALVIGRRGLGHRARRRATGNQTAPEDAARPAQARTRTIPAAGTAPRKPATPPDPRQPPGAKTGRPHRDTAGDQAAQHRPGPPTRQGYVLLAQ